jgi:hypothetical protein
MHTSPLLLLLYLSHNTKIFLGAFSGMQANTAKKKKNLFSLKSFLSKNILQWKIFYSETNGSSTDLF